MTVWAAVSVLQDGEDYYLDWIEHYPQRQVLLKDLRRNQGPSGFYAPILQAVKRFFERHSHGWVRH